MVWVKRVEAILNALKGSSISEIELVEGELEIILRRSPGTLVAVQTAPVHIRQQSSASSPASSLHLSAMKSPLTGVYYASPSPTDAPFIKVGDIIKVGQTIALIEAMKVFSEIASDVSGRVVAVKVQSGAVVKKGEVIFQVEPL